MRTVWFAAGMATGYVFGAKAGRDKYQQIAEAARSVARTPTVENAQSQVTALFGHPGTTQNRPIVARSAP
jgi:hypothetical protein